MSKNAYEIGTEIIENYAAGRDPRKMTEQELKNMGFNDIPLLKVIRKKCLDCAGNSEAEIRRCTAVSCELWPYRMGKNPLRKRKELTQDQKEKLVQRMNMAREKKKP